MAQKSRAWQFTINNYKTLDILKCLELNTKYYIVGEEVGLKGTPHLQGYCYFENPRALGGVKKLLGEGHYEQAKGTAEQNKTYCSKEGKFYEGGIMPKQGERKDLNKLKEEILGGRSVINITLENANTYHQYGRTLNYIEDIRMRSVKRNVMTLGTWIWGTTGVGKSHKAREMTNGGTIYDMPYDKNGWCEGYEQQDYVIMDDFRGELQFNVLLKMIDKWPFTLPRRGREPIPFISKHVIITSSKPPNRVYKNTKDEDLAQLYRRIQVINLVPWNGTEVIG